MQSEKDKIMELLTVTEVKEGGEVTFTDRSIEILQELGQQYKETPLFKKSRQDNPDWEGDANAGLFNARTGKGHQEKTKERQTYRD